MGSCKNYFEILRNLYRENCGKNENKRIPSKPSSQRSNSPTGVVCGKVRKVMIFGVEGLRMLEIFPPSMEFCSYRRRCDGERGKEVV